MPIDIRVEGKRGCGYRKPGGFYLVLPKFRGRDCGKLPLPLESCPCCGNGIKFSRGWTWINGKLLFDKECASSDCVNEISPDHCPLHTPPEKMGLLWIGREFYKTPEDWLSEGRKMGISRRIKGVPHGFKLGETWVAVAHVEAIPGKDGEKGTSAIFQVFRPTAVEYVVKGDETPEEIEAIEKRGITPVKVEKEQRELFEK